MRAMSPLQRELERALPGPAHEVFLGPGHGTRAFEKIGPEGEILGYWTYARPKLLSPTGWCSMQWLAKSGGQAGLGFGEQAAASRTSVTTTRTERPPSI